MTEISTDSTPFASAFDALDEVELTLDAAKVGREAGDDATLGYG